MSVTRITRLRILVIDPNRFSRTLLVNVLNAQGIRDVSDVGDLPRLWTKLAISTYDVIFLDAGVDESGGLYFNRHLLVELLTTPPDTPMPHCHIVLVRRNVTAEALTSATNAGVTEIVAKPISAERVLSRLTAVVDHPKLFVKAGNYVGPTRRRRTVKTAPERRRTDH